MQYREYGNTGKMVSVLGFGTSRFLREDYATDSGQEKIVHLLCKSNEMGINFFDTGAAYGDGRCEKLLGQAIKQMPNECYISTKSHDCRMDATEMRRRLDCSLRALDVNKVHFYHMWRVLNMDQFNSYMRKGGPYEGALAAQNEGLIDHICFSAHCSGDEIAEIAASGYFEGVILSYNLLNFKYREVGLRAAKKYNLGVAIMNPLGGGVIPRCASAFSFAAREGVENISDIALNFCSSHSEVSLVLSGMTNETELENNISAMDKAAVFSDQWLEEVKSNIVEEFNSLCNGCQYCRGCPQHIDIYKLMLSYNNYTLRDAAPRAFFEEIVNWGFLPRGPFPCIECGLCEEKCSQHIPIRERIRELNSLIEQRESNLRQGMERCFGLSENKKIGIYGAGEYAREMLLQAKEFYGTIDFEFTVFDSSPQKVGKKFSPYSCVVHPPEDIPVLGINRLIIASEDHYNSIYQNVAQYEADGVEIVGFTLGKQYQKLSSAALK